MEMILAKEKSGKKKKNNAWMNVYLFFIMPQGYIYYLHKINNSWDIK